MTSESVDKSELTIEDAWLQAEVEKLGRQVQEAVMKCLLEAPHPVPPEPWIVVEFFAEDGDE